MPGWTCVEEIIAYQLAVSLRDRVLTLLDNGTIPFNFHLRDQIADAARSVPANIVEGFERYTHGQFSYHVGVAKGSLGELKTHLEETRTRGFLTDDQLTELLKLLIETKKTTSGLLRHLKTREAPEPWSDPR
jgi:four helix bundle protein